MAMWVKFTDGTSGSFTWRDRPEDVIVDCQQRTGKTVETMWSIPYPASPVIFNDTGCPPFCYTPERCAGKGGCPKMYACSE